MAYSIYFQLKPEALEVIDEVSSEHPVAFLKARFTDSWDRVPDKDDGLLWSWIKPRGDKSSESKLFAALSFLHNQGLVDGLTADNWKGQPPIKQKLITAGFEELLSVVKPES